MLDSEDQTGLAVGVLPPEQDDTVLGLTLLTPHHGSIRQAEPGHQLRLQDGLRDAAHDLRL